MTTISSRESMMNEFAIAELAKELEAVHYELSVYKAGLADEGTAHLTTKIEVKGHLHMVNDLLDAGNVKHARVFLEALIARL